jgi:hypothetical protein
MQRLVEDEWARAQYLNPEVKVRKTTKNGFIS